MKIPHITLDIYGTLVAASTVTLGIVSPIIEEVNATLGTLSLLLGVLVATVTLLRGIKELRKANNTTDKNPPL